jgi:hypothetical protein
MMTRIKIDNEKEKEHVGRTFGGINSKISLYIFWS